MASLRFKPGYPSSALPKLDMMAVNQLLCLHHSYVVIRAIERNRFLKLAIWTDDICTAIWHLAAPLNQAGAQNSCHQRR
jgi:hypothetical protein